MDELDTLSLIGEEPYISRARSLINKAIPAHQSNHQEDFGIGGILSEGPR